jgi:hypothetical protein
MEMIVVVEAGMAEEKRVFNEKQARRRQEFDEKIKARDDKLREIEERRLLLEQQDQEVMSGSQNQEME